MAPKTKPVIHTAAITCGHCGHETKIALGHAYAIVCKGCKAEIVIVEQDYRDEVA